MMPLFFLIFVVLAARVALLPGSASGYEFMFIPRWEALKDPTVWITAMGQAFFSLSVTGSGMIAYGSYLDRKEDVIAVSRHTAIFDTIAALVAALVIIPACFSYDVSVDAGPSLLFITLPSILQDIPLGQVFAIILYAAMIFAGVSSLQNMFEAVAESLLHRFPKLRRTVALGIICVICLGAGIGMEAITRWGIWMDLVSIYIIPIGATLGAISWFWIMKKNDLFSIIEHVSYEQYENVISNTCINDCNEYKQNLLHEAIACCRNDIATNLINRNNINQQDYKGETPLHYCAAYFNLEIAELLLQKKAQINIIDKYGNNPLWVAVFKCRRSTCCSGKEPASQRHRGSRRRF